MTRHILLPIAIAALLLAATGCEEDTDDAYEVCLAHCEHIGASEGCPDSVANQEVVECKQGCGGVTQLWSDECVEAARELWLCSMSELTYKCDPGDDTPYSEDDACDDEGEVFGACMFGTP